MDFYGVYRVSKLAPECFGGWKNGVDAVFVVALALNRGIVQGRERSEKSACQFNAIFDQLEPTVSIVCARQTCLWWDVVNNRTL